MKNNDVGLLLCMAFGAFCALVEIPGANSFVAGMFVILAMRDD